MKLPALVTLSALLVIRYGNEIAAKPPATNPTSQAATHPSLKAINLDYGVHPARIELHVSIAPDGLLHYERTDNKSYGPADAPVSNERHEIRQGRLTPQQITDLAGLFAGWESLSTDPYGGIADGPEISLRYGDKTISGGSATPKQAWDIQARLIELSDAMPVVEK